jgi:hypothetical protein
MMQSIQLLPVARVVRRNPRDLRGRRGFDGTLADAGDRAGAENRLDNAQGREVGPQRGTTLKEAAVGLVSAAADRLGTDAMTHPRSQPPREITGEE